MFHTPKYHDNLVFSGCECYRELAHRGSHGCGGHVLTGDSTPKWAAGRQPTQKKRLSFLKNKRAQLARHFGGVVLGFLKILREGGPSSFYCRAEPPALNWYVPDPHTPPYCAAKVMRESKQETLGTGCSETGTHPCSIPW